MKKKFIHIYLNLLLLVLAIYANTSYEYKGEFSILEGLQNTFLIMILYFQFKFRRLFFKFSNKVAFYLRNFLFLFILYEEISILTKDLSQVFNFINSQQEINIHNLIVNQQVLINNLNLPFLGYQINITLAVLVSILVPIIFGFGSYLPYFSRVKFFFIEREYSFYTMIYLVFIIINSLNKHKLNNVLNVVFEFSELFLYNLFFIDLLIKIQKMKNLNSRLN